MLYWIALSFGCALAMAVVWLCLGKWIAQGLDSCFRRRGVAIKSESEWFLIGGGVFVLGDRRWPLSKEDVPGLAIETENPEHVVLCAGGRRFVLGRVLHKWSDPVSPQYDFKPEEGDVVTFTRHAGTAWWTPLTFSLFGGPTPKWKRFAYSRLLWRKASRTRLKVVWRDQDWFYHRDGWRTQYHVQLLQVRIRP